MTFDLITGSTVMWDGSTRSTWLRIGDRWRRATPPNAPPSRFHSAIAADLARGRIVLFGGAGGLIQRLDDTWEFDGVDWTLQAPAQRPAGRFGHTLTYDLQRGRSILFGGAVAAGDNAETWAYDGNGWSRLAPPTTPPGRTGHAAAFDFARDRLVVFGGSDNSGTLRTDTWEFDGADWAPAAATGPAGRVDHEMVYSPSSGAVWMFGSAPVAGEPAAWSFDGAAWSPLPGGDAFARQNHAAAYDLIRGAMIVHGGATSGPAIDDTLEFDGQNWSRWDSPGPRIGHAMAHDGRRGRTVLFAGIAGANAGTALEDAKTWELDGRRWQRRITATSPAPRSGHGMVWDRTRGHVLLFGGGQLFQQLADTWRYDGTDWAPIATPTSPPARSGHAMTWDSGRGRAVVFGGFGNTFTSLGDTWEFDGVTWQQISSAGGPSSRRYAAMAYDAARARSVLFGGDVSTGATTTPSDETWEFDGASWQPVTVPVRPPARAVHAMWYDVTAARVRMIGGTSGAAGADTWEFDGVAWQLLAAADEPLPRTWWAATYDDTRHRAVLHGGTRNGEVSSVARELEPAAVPTWSPYGTGCSGRGGTPRLDADATLGAVPALGGTLGLRVSALPPAPAVAVLLLLGVDVTQWNAAPLPVALDGIGLAGCRAWIAPDPALTMLQLPAPGAAAAAFALGIPADPALRAVVFGAQALVLDPAAANGIGAVSNAGVGRVD
ncbi:MAG: kelch repeat-containing protein [Planctomycetota bacterium]